ncbi:MAG: efflux RND transporter periplasmic adaptor subunit [Pseudomonas sp.]|uniref:efflux RND transporter periplasmic adaptor subunit n=1 Tax=Pseudomonas sp. TaxID=306 RepID=UPI0030F2A435
MKRCALLPVCAAVLALAIAGCSKQEAPKPEPRPVLYSVVKIEQQAMVGKFAGSIEARFETTVGFRTNGRIASRTVNVGDKVAKGTLLATLDPSDQENQLRASEGQMAGANAQWLQAQADARRQTELFDRGVGAKANLDDAQTRLKTTRATLDQAAADVQHAKDQVEYTRLLSDFDGVVTHWNAEIGQVVAAGQEVLTLARPDVREAVFDLPDEQVPSLPADARFKVTSQLQGDVQADAHIREMAPQADATTRSRRVRLTLEQSPDELRLGTTINVELTSVVPAHSTLPASALIAGADGTDSGKVWVIDPNSLAVNQQSVHILERKGEQVIIGEGLRDGDWVVRAGVNSLEPGQVVKLDGEAAQ